MPSSESPVNGPLDNFPVPSDPNYTADFNQYDQTVANGNISRVENGNENVGAIQTPIIAPANNPRYVSPQSFLDNVNLRYVINGNQP